MQEWVQPHLYSSVVLSDARSENNGWLYGRFFVYFSPGGALICIGKDPVGFRVWPNHSLIVFQCLDYLLYEWWGQERYLRCLVNVFLREKIVFLTAEKRPWIARTTHVRALPAFPNLNAKIVFSPKRATFHSFSADGKRKHINIRSGIRTSIFVRFGGKWAVSFAYAWAVCFLHPI